MKKGVLVGCVILISVIVFVYLFKGYARKENLNYEIEQVNEINYMLINENNKFGVINKSGEVVVSPIYDEIDIPNPSKALFVCMYNYNEEKQEYNIKVLNDKAEQILYEYVIVEAIKINPTVSKIPYEKSVLKIKKNGKYGLIDFQGNIIVKPNYEQIESLDCKEGLLCVKKDGKYGVINIKGGIVLKEKYDSIQSDGYYEENSGYNKSGFVIGEKENDIYKYGYINSEGKQLLDIKYNQIERIYNNNKNDDTYLVAFENEKAGFYKNSNNILKHEYEDIIYDFNNNCLIIQKDNKQGVFDLNGNEIINVQYDNIFTSGKYVNAQNESIIDIYNYNTKEKINIDNVIAVNETLNTKYAIVITTQEKYKILNLENNELKTEEYDYLEYMYDNNFIANKQGKYGIVNAENGTVLLKFKYDLIIKTSNNKVAKCILNKDNITEVFIKDKIAIKSNNINIHIYDNFINIIGDDCLKYFDFEGNILDSTQIIDKQLYAKEEKGKWGFVNKNGDIIVEYKYDFVTEFNELGFAGIMKNGKWGSINLNGEVVIEPIYEIDTNYPKFIAKYYEIDLGYGNPYYVCENSN